MLKVFKRLVQHWIRDRLERLDMLFPLSVRKMHSSADEIGGHKYRGCCQGKRTIAFFLDAFDQCGMRLCFANSQSSHIATFIWSVTFYKTVDLNRLWGLCRRWAIHCIPWCRFPVSYRVPAVGTTNSVGFLDVTCEWQALNKYWLPVLRHAKIWSIGAQHNVTSSDVS